jgi:hypothetical protein
MYKHDGLLYYQAGHYGTEKACLRVTSLVSVTHVHERGGLLRRDFIYIQVHASASPAEPSPSALSATSLSLCEMVGSTTSEEACYAEISCENTSKPEGNCRSAESTLKARVLLCTTTNYKLEPGPVPSRPTYITITLAITARDARHRDQCTDQFNEDGKDTSNTTEGT